ncbi:doubled CXXCH motif-containing protein [Shewanella psychrophila]|uniref:Doubled CXXCH motif-containing protein n=1 Tax=Shewanella psychrophila TaxID=225848 RepID=A0A1S6HUB6_9GAMM|nr:ammonia-forming cytochrome c nitrite reductase subunit c552 [Shewanella psychrophila]AQS39145.1 doubled CXXCH motif-containing protein [Shewanella psychrophila]
MSIALLGLLLLSTFICPFVMAADGSPSLVGSASCQTCHSEQYRQWQTSHHYLAMSVATQTSVLGDFNNSQFTYNGVTSRFYRRGGKFYVTTDNAEGKLQEFHIGYTFGVYPLQQYLIDFPNGAKQVLSIIWDTRSKEEGGQRWYHLYPEQLHGVDEPELEAIDHNDPLHWTGSMFNWNSRCAGCHSTGLEVNYEPENNSFNTQWFEINVGCEACHGSGEQHLKWAEKPGKKTKTLLNKGFPQSINNLAKWGHIADSKSGSSDIYQTFTRSGPIAQRQKETCAACHSRRTPLQLSNPGHDYNDDHLLSLLQSPLYYADGQMREEVFVWGSFLQSKMQAAGVTCSNCHNPHSLSLKAEGNVLCTQCHNPSVFDQLEHHHHEGEGAECVSCHMPTTTYMGVDGRQDHSFRIPRPALAARIGAPNACSQCHSDKSNSWAQKTIDNWNKARGKQPSKHDFAEAFFDAESGEINASTALLQIALDSGQVGIARGSAILRHGKFHNADSLKATQALLLDADPLVRLGAVRSMDALPIDLKARLLLNHLEQSSKSVRVEIARQLASLPLEQLPKAQANLILTMFDEFIESAKFNASAPESQVLLGLFYFERQNYVLAEQAYLQALKISPRFESAGLNLADLYRLLGREKQSLAMLKQTLKRFPGSAAANYSMGLWYVRDRDYAAALNWLLTASELDPVNGHYAITYALGLDKLNNRQEAKVFLRDWITEHGAQPQVKAVLNSLR